MSDCKYCAGGSVAENGLHEIDTAIYYHSEYEQIAFMPCTAKQYTDEDVERLVVEAQKVLDWTFDDVFSIDANDSLEKVLAPFAKDEDKI